MFATVLVYTDRVMTALARAAAAAASTSLSEESLAEPSTMHSKWVAPAAAGEPGGKDHTLVRFGQFWCSGVRLLARRIAEASATRLETSSVSVSLLPAEACNTDRAISVDSSFAICAIATNYERS